MFLVATDDRYLGLDALWLARYHVHCTFQVGLWTAVALAQWERLLVSRQLTGGLGLHGHFLAILASIRVVLLGCLGRGVVSWWETFARMGFGYVAARVLRCELLDCLLAITALWESICLRFLLPSWVEGGLLWHHSTWSYVDKDLAWTHRVSLLVIKGLEAVIDLLCDQVFRALRVV